MTLAHLLHVLMIQWGHNHHIVTHLALRYLHREYPGMPHDWYQHYLSWLARHHYSPRDW